MNRLMMLAGLLVGLSACHAPVGIGSNGQGPAPVATDAWQSAIAQASIGVVPAAYFH
jgi:hypothetical protein